MLSIVAIMSIISLAFLWIIYALYYRLKERKFLATGITFLFAIPFTLLINSILSKMIGDYARRKGYEMKIQLIDFGVKSKKISLINQIWKKLKHKNRCTIT